MGRFHKAASGIDHIERLGRGDSVIHRLPPAPKALVTLIFICLVVSVPGDRPGALVSFVLYPAVLMPLSGTPVKPVLSRLRMALPFALFGGISNLIFIQKPAFAIGGFVVTFGLLSFISILLKTGLSVCAVLLLIATTPFTALAECLTAPRFFRPLGLQLALSYRYIATLLSEVESMWTAYSLRAPGSKAVALADFGSFFGQLLLRSFDRAQRIYDAMRCRGFSGVYYGPARPRRLRESIVFVACAAAALVMLRFFPPSVLLGRFL